MILLALDTSTSYASLALVRDGALLADLTWRVGMRHSVELLPRMRALLADCDVAPAALGGVAVALGPGSFNGARVAVSTAKALALALRIPLYGHSTLDVIGWGHAVAGGPLWAVLEAGRGQLYAARYRGGVASAEAWRAEVPAAIVDPAALAAQWGEPALLCGEWSAATGATLVELLGARLRLATGLGGRRGAWLAELALARAAQGTYDDSTALEPLYLRAPAITTPRDRSPTPGTPARGEGAERALQL